MNVCIVSGELVGNAVLRGKEKKVLVFTVATKNLNGDLEIAVSYAPCVVFNPSEELAELLTTQGKGMAIELQGRVSANRFEMEAEPRANGEVVVYNKSLRIGPVGSIPVANGNGSGNGHAKPRAAWRPNEPRIEPRIPVSAEASGAD